MNFRLGSLNLRGNYVLLDKINWSIHIIAGAKMVFIGRPQAWGSIYNNTDGVLNVLDILHDELVNIAHLAGTPTLQHIDRDMIVNPFGTNCPTSGANQVNLQWSICFVLLICFVEMWSASILYRWKQIVHTYYIMYITIRKLLII